MNSKLLKNIRIIHVIQTGSTQDLAFELLQNSSDLSILLTTDIQTSGRGRKNDDWQSPDGGFWATLAIKLEQKLSIEQLALCHYATALLIKRAINDEYNIAVDIKWPNDIKFQKRKMGGILVEYITGNNKNYLLLGMGVDINNSSLDLPNELQNITISVSDVLNHQVKLDLFAKKICNLTETYLSPILANSKTEIEQIQLEYNKSCSIVGKEVFLKDENGVDMKKSYKCLGITTTGILRFEHNNSFRNLNIGQSNLIKKIIF
ncbi:MAG: biotin--[acetyl-CoA-carboxylase] ligase [Promethearchaeota archaeon]